MWTRTSNPIAEYFFEDLLYPILHMAEISQTQQLYNPLSSAFHKYWHLLNCILVDLGRFHNLTVSKRSDKQKLRFKEGAGNNPLPLLARYIS